MRQLFVLDSMRYGCHPDFRIDCGQGVLSRERLVAAEGVSEVSNLALQVGEIHAVAVADGNVANAGSGQIQRDG